MRQEGARIRIVYSPADAEKYAKEHPKEQVVFLSMVDHHVGYVAKKAGEDGLSNYSLLVATRPFQLSGIKGQCGCVPLSRTCQCDHRNCALRASGRGRHQWCGGRLTAKELLTALAVALVRFQEGKPFFVNCYPRGGKK